jgi:hypothetical protein
MYPPKRSHRRLLRRNLVNYIPFHEIFRTRKEAHNESAWNKRGQRVYQVVKGKRSAFEETNRLYTTKTKMEKLTQVTYPPPHHALTHNDLDHERALSVVIFCFPVRFRDTTGGKVEKKQDKDSTRRLCEGARYVGMYTRLSRGGNRLELLREGRWRGR